MKLICCKTHFVDVIPGNQRKLYIKSISVYQQLVTRRIYRKQKKAVRPHMRCECEQMKTKKLRSNRHRLPPDTSRRIEWHHTKILCTLESIHYPFAARYCILCSHKIVHGRGQSATKPREWKRLDIEYQARKRSGHTRSANARKRPPYGSHTSQARLTFVFYWLRAIQ